MLCSLLFLYFQKTRHVFLPLICLDFDTLCLEVSHSSSLSSHDQTPFEMQLMHNGAWKVSSTNRISTKVVSTYAIFCLEVSHSSSLSSRDQTRDATEYNSGVHLRRQLMKRQLPRQMIVRKLLFLVCCFFSVI